MSEVTATVPVGSRVAFDFGDGSPGGWREDGTVAGYEENRLVIALDETIELPDWLGGGWCCEVEREADEVYDVRPQNGSSGTTL
jgi:hypothetical protein